MGGLGSIIRLVVQDSVRGPVVAERQKEKEIKLVRHLAMCAYPSESERSYGIMQYHLSVS